MARCHSWKHTAFRGAREAMHVCRQLAMDLGQPLTLLPPRSLKGKGLVGTIPSPWGWELPPRLQRLQLSSNNISGEARGEVSLVECKQLQVRRQPAIAATRPAASRRQLGAERPPGWARTHHPTQAPSLQTGRCRPAWS